jgi:hypothetical protein
VTLVDLSVAKAEKVVPAAPSNVGNRPVMVEFELTAMVVAETVDLLVEDTLDVLVEETLDVLVEVDMLAETLDVLVEVDMLAEKTFDVLVEVDMLAEKTLDVLEKTLDVLEKTLDVLEKTLDVLEKTLDVLLVLKVFDMMTADVLGVLEVELNVEMALVVINGIVDLEDEPHLSVQTLVQLIDVTPSFQCSPRVTHTNHRRIQE